MTVVEVLLGLLTAPLHAARPRHARPMRALGHGRLVHPRTELIPVPAYQRRRP